MGLAAGYQKSYFCLLKAWRLQRKNGGFSQSRPGTARKASFSLPDSWLTALSCFRRTSSALPDAWRAPGRHVPLCSTRPVTAVTHIGNIPISGIPIFDITSTFEPGINSFRGGGVPGAVIPNPPVVVGSGPNNINDRYQIQSGAPSGTAYIRCVLLTALDL